MDPSLLKETTPSNVPTPKLRSPTPEGSPKKRKLYLFVRKLSVEWNYLLVRLRTFAEYSSTDRALADLFQSSEEDFLERHRAGGSPLTLTEHQFLSDYKRYKTLDRIHAAHTSERTVMKVFDGDDMAERTNVVSDTLTDCSERREENVGEMLWEHRRERWLAATPDGASPADRAQHSSLKHIPRDLYPRLYRDFVLKSRPLRADKRINLEDLVLVIDAGWASEDKWERAAKGLP